MKCATKAGSEVYESVRLYNDCSWIFPGNVNNQATVVEKLVETTVCNSSSLFLHKLRAGNLGEKYSVKLGSKEFYVHWTTASLFPASI